MNIPRNAVMEGNDVAALNWTIVSQAAIATLEEELASISRFSLDVSGEFKTDGDSVKVEVIDGAGEALKNTEDWNQSELEAMTDFAFHAAARIAQQCIELFFKAIFLIRLPDEVQYRQAFFPFREP